MLGVVAKGRRLCGRYTLLEKLGEGGQGEIWRAHDQTRSVDVALKIIPRGDSAWQALEREHAVVSRLQHPSILEVYPPYQDEQVVVLPMELAAGGDLRRLRGADYLEIVPILIEIAQALEHAHERGIIHRDLKPSNVLFDSRGRVRIADFGIAGTALDASSSGGSPFTASPEQLYGASPAPTDDIYGLGALAYELLSGYPPYYPHFELKRVIEEPVPELKPTQQIPPRLAALVMRMLAKRPQSRPQSMREVIDDLDAVLHDTLVFELAPAAGSAAAAGGRALAGEPMTAFERRAAGGGGVTPPLGRIVNRGAGSSSQGSASAAFAPVVNVTEPTMTALRDEPISAPPKPERVVRPVRQVPERRSTAAPNWENMRTGPVPSLMRLEPEKPPRRWPWAMLIILAAVAVFGVFYWLPNFAPKGLSVSLPNLPSLPQVGGGGTQASASQPDVPARSAPISSSGSAAANANVENELREARRAFDQRLASLESRAAGLWGGSEFATAKTRAAESIGAYDAGSPALAVQRLKEALSLLDTVESRADEALEAQLAAGDRAIEAGQAELATQAFELANRIEPENARATEGLQRVRNLSSVLPLLAEGENAEAARQYSRAVQAYSKALELDPNNARAKQGVGRANAALGNDTYSRAVGTGFAALGAGRLESARASFERARSIRPNGKEAAEGLSRVEAALRARGFAELRQRATALEAEERWGEALKEYETALQSDPSLAFALQGRARASERAALARQLQDFIDRPERMATAAVRAEAEALIERAKQQSPSGPVLRSQIARLEILLPEFDKPVRVALISDNSTQVAIQRVGSFGTFARREIDLKPGKYTIVGTRAGYRDVRRDITVAPGQDVQTISVECVEPI